MPYIIETYRESHEITRLEQIARVAVATLDEAREAARSTMDAALNGQPPAQNEYEWTRPMPEAGGTIGPLPDRTEIVVRSVSWSTVAADAPLAFVGDPLSIYDAEAILAAFNATSGSA